MSCPRPNVVYVVHRVPHPPDKGDRIRGWHVLRHLACHANVFLACLADEEVGASTRDALAACCAAVEIVPVRGPGRWARALGHLASGGSISAGAFHAPALDAVLRRWTGEVEFHGAVASASSVGPYLLRGALRRIPRIIDLVDIDSQKWFDYANATRVPLRWLYQLEGRRVRRLESLLAQESVGLTVVSDTEAELFRTFGPPDAVHVAPNGVDLDYCRPAGAPGEGCVFVGALDYRPNVDAVVWFCREVWPGVRSRRRDARLRLVGRRPASEVLQLAALPGVEVVGQTPDVRPFVRDAALSLAPLRIARGIQNKILEAMAMARPVICSPQAHAGLLRNPPPPVRTAAAPEEWVASIVELLGRPDLCAELGRQGRRYVETHHDWQRCLQPLGALLGLQGRQESLAPSGGKPRETAPVGGAAS